MAMGGRGGAGGLVERPDPRKYPSPTVRSKADKLTFSIDQTMGERTMT